MQEFHQTTASFVWKSYVDQARRMALANWAIASLSFYSGTAANFLFLSEKGSSAKWKQCKREKFWWKLGHIFSFVQKIGSIQLQRAATITGLVAL